MIAAMVFAAGLGTRMRPLTNDRPKAMVEVAGRPLIDHALEQVVGAAPVAVNAHHFADRLAAHLAGRDLTLLREDPLLETGGGLRNARPVLGDGPVLTMNADAAWTGPTAIATLRAAWAPERMDGLLLLVPPDRAAGRIGADFGLEADGRVTRDARPFGYTGAGIVKTGGLDAVPDTVFSLWSLWQPMLEAGRLFGVEHPGGWADVGSPAGIAEAEAMLAAAI
ncbi:nucleotidyltransferase family protein [uncultured Jannaschia sp.]|uniref:nucleotidyltransferase family protein n=1 Tax=uncultured Jannaschia sp. TaxID=293347 RepID=UPI002610AAC6|nr:nucleotidyltransferase family protein [uncultured Jannaschia sp.]